MTEEPDDRPMNVLIVHAQPTSSDGGGSFRILSHFLKDADRKRFHLQVVLSILDRSILEEGPGPIRFLREQEIPVHFLHVPMNQARANPFVQFRYLLEVAGAVWKIRGLIRREGIDLVYTNSLNILPGGIAARLAGVRSVYHIHEIVRRPRILARLLARIIGRLADVLICVSEAAQAPFMEVGVPVRKLRLVPNCIDLREFSASTGGQAFREEYAENGCQLVVTVGRILPKKGHHYIVEAAKQIVEEIPSVRFLFVGQSKWTGDDYIERLKEMIARFGLGKRVVFTGLRQDIPEIMAAADVTILAATSESTPESFGLVILESLAMGTPIVASRLGGIPEIVRDGETGYLVPPRDPNALASAILRLLRSKKKALDMGRTGQAIVQREYSAEDYSTRIEDVLIESAGSLYKSPGSK